MNAAEYRRALTVLGFTNKTFADFAGIADRSSRRFAAGDQGVPRVIALLLKALLRDPKLIGYLMKKN